MSGQWSARQACALRAVLAVSALVGCGPRQDEPGVTATGDAVPLFTARVADPPPPPTAEAFAGSDACGTCHAQMVAVWRRSTHGTAGGVPGNTAAP
ncbi:hypothetical protein [Gemmatimonas sp.]|uniref:hypothetical protein n=1 Tax=Gemmatimonas sp. TaxID=1962908 RepID=UPI00356543F8